MKTLLPLLLIGTLSFSSLRGQEILSVTYDTLTLTETAATDSLLWPQNVRLRLEELLHDPFLNTSQLGLCVYDLTDDSLLFAHGEQQLLRPASCQKILTAAAALSELGGSYRFETCLYRTGTLAEEDTVLYGDLYIVGGMDPAFGHDDLKAFVHTLSGMGIRRITGRIYTDRSFKDTLQWGKGWCWDDDEAVLSPLLYNGRDDFAQAFLEALAEEGIVCDSTMLNGRLPDEGAVLMVNRFHTMDQILMQMMKQSDNLYAESMFYQLAARDKSPYADSRQAAQAVERLIRKAGLNPDDYRVADGSGLSLYNYASARLLVAVLRLAWHNNQISLHLIPSLPVAGIDGTLKRRMRSGCAYGNVRAKTGTLTGISSLAGYATAANGHTLAFAIINQGIRKGAPARRFQDRVCEALTRP